MGIREKYVKVREGPEAAPGSGDHPVHRVVKSHRGRYGFARPAPRVDGAEDHAGQPLRGGDRRIRDVLATIHASHEHVKVRPGIILQLHRDLYKFSAEQDLRASQVIVNERSYRQCGDVH